MPHYCQYYLNSYLDYWLQHWLHFNTCLYLSVLQNNCCVYLSSYSGILYRINVGHTLDGGFLQISRSFRREGNELVQVVGMATENTPHTEHLIARYQRQS